MEVNYIRQKNRRLFEVEKSSICFFILCIAFKVTYELLYIYQLYGAFDYYYARLSITMLDMDAWKCFCSYLIFFILLLLTPKYTERPSSQLTQLFWVTTIIPMLSYYWLASASNTYTLYYALCYSILCAFLRGKKSISPKLIKFKRILPIENLLIWVLPALLIVFSAFNSFPNLSLFNIYNVYEFREAASYSGFWSYFVSWMGAALIPFCLIVFLVKKKYLMVLFAGAMEIYLYLCTGDKVYLFSIIILLVLYVGLINKIWKLFMPLFYTLVILATCVFFAITGSDALMAISPQRQLTLPAALSYRYYDFFTENPKVNFADGFIGNLLSIHSPYPETAGRVIGEAQGSNAVTGYLGDAYANGGLLAMLIFTVAIALIFLFIDGVSKNSKTRYLYTGVMLYFMTSLANSAFLTTLLTGGLMVMVVLMYLYASQEESMKLLSETHMAKNSRYIKPWHSKYLRVEKNPRRDVRDARS